MEWWDWVQWSLFLEYWILSQLSLSSFNLIKRLFYSPVLSPIRVVLAAYLRVLIFFPTVLIPAWTLSILEFHMIYSAYKLEKQGDNIQPWCTPFLNFELVRNSISGPNCCFLTCIQISCEAGKVIWYSHTFKIFPQFVRKHTVKSFSAINEA